MKGPQGRAPTLRTTTWRSTLLNRVAMPRRSSVWPPCKVIQSGMKASLRQQRRRDQLRKEKGGAFGRWWLTGRPRKAWIGKEVLRDGDGWCSGLGRRESGEVRVQGASLGASFAGSGQRKAGPGSSAWRRRGTGLTGGHRCGVGEVRRCFWSRMQHDTEGGAGGVLVVLRVRAARSRGT